MPQLRVLLGYQQGQIFSLAGGSLSIGRDPDTNVMLHPESAGSRRHAEIFPKDGGWFLRDLGSVNGTRLNGNRVAEAPIADKDEVVIGDNVFVFEDEDAVVSAIAEAASRALPAESRGVVHRPAVQELVEQVRGRVAALARKIGENGIVVGDVLAALISRGHVVLGGMGGATDAAFVRSLAGMFDLKCERVRFTPDVTERDLFGVEGAGRLVQGPIFAQIFFAEEFNCAPDGPQTVLIEAMEEYSIAAEGMKFALEPLFFVMATQGGVGEAGVRALSAERIDRFMFSISTQGASVPPDAASEKIFSAREILELQKTVLDLPMSDHLVKFAIRLVRATRPADAGAPDFIRKYVSSGAGPRGAHALILGAKARAIIAGRSLVTADDIRATACCALAHRVFGNAAALREGANGEAIVRRLVAAVGEP